MKSLNGVLTIVLSVRLLLLALALIGSSKLSSLSVSLSMITSVIFAVRPALLIILDGEGKLLLILLELSQGGFLSV